MNKRTNGRRERIGKAPALSGKLRARAGNFLPSKVGRPILAHAFPRKRLFEALDRARARHPVVWLSGPPGAGKTTLASTYIEARKLSCVWYQIDSGDADPATLFHYLALAVKAVSRRKQPLPHLTPEHFAGLRVFARRFFEEAFERLPRPAVIVLDNYQEISTETVVHSLVTGGFELLLPDISVLVCSRQPPPASYARLVANQRCAVIEADGLRLSDDEAMGIARLRKGQRRDRREVQRLNEEARGWAAGLTLMLERRRSVDLTSEEKPPEMLFDYFAGEVFRHLDATAQRHLMMTALLPRMTRTLLCRFTGDEQAAEMIDKLANRNYFALKHPGREPAYEYHPLFRSFLLKAAREQIPHERLLALRRNAAGLLENDGAVEDAHELLVQTQDWTLLVPFVLGQASVLAEQGRTTTLLQWIGQIPEAIVATVPWLLYWQAACAIPNIATTRPGFERALALFEQEGDAMGCYLAWSGIVETYSLEWNDFHPLQRWVDKLWELRARFPAFPSPEIEAQVTLSVVTALMYSSLKHPELPRWAGAARRWLSHMTEPGQRLRLSAMFTIYYSWTGDLSAGWQLMHELRPLANSAKIAPMTRIMFYCVSAVYYWIVAIPERCLAEAQAGLALASDTDLHFFDPLLHNQCAYAYLIRGQFEEAARITDVVAESVPPTVRSYYSMLQSMRGLIALHRDRLPEALAFAKNAVQITINAGMPFGCAHNHCQIAGVLLELGDTSGAEEHVRAARNIVPETPSGPVQYALVATESRIAFARGETDKARALMEDALRAGREMGGAAMVFWTRDALVRFYVQALEAGIEIEFVRDMIRRHGLAADPSALDSEHWPRPFRIYTLGRFSILRDGQPFTMGSSAQRRPLELLKALIAFGGRQVSQGRLTETLWPDADGDTAQQAFETTLYRLRKLLGNADVLILRDGMLTLDPKFCWVDCWTFERLSSRFDQMASDKATDDDTLRIGRQTIALYRGPFLGDGSGLGYELLLRERLRTRFLRLISGMGRIYEARMAWDDAVGCYELGLDTEPLAEDFYRRLIRSYLAQKRPAEALAVYERCRRVLNDALGVAPSAETEQLRHAAQD